MNKEQLTQIKRIKTWKPKSRENSTFYIVETNNGLVLSISENKDGYNVHAPIQPSPETGSSLHVAGGQWPWDKIDGAELYDILKYQKNIHIPNWNKKARTISFDAFMKNEFNSRVYK